MMKITTQQNVRLAIFMKLKKITKIGYPYTYGMIQTHEGFQAAEQEILEFVSQYSTSLNNALSQLESSYAQTYSSLVKSTDSSGPKRPNCQ